MEDKFECEECGVENEYVRFEGYTDSFICDSCLDKLKREEKE